MWLASYPKSGNTWMRVFLENLFRNEAQPININDFKVARYGDAEPAMYAHFAGRAYEELSEDDILELRRVSQDWLANRPETSFVKTHSCVGDFNGKPLIYLNNTAGAIYVVRNVFDVVVSAHRHFGATLQEAVDGVCRESMHTPTGSQATFQILNTWSNHYRSWTSVPGFEPLVVRYEDLVKKPLKTFSKVVKYLNLPSGPDRIKRAIKFSSIGELQKQEQSAGFKERPEAAEKFFHSGETGGFRKHLTTAQIDQLTEAHQDVLKELGYLRSGRITV